MNGGDRVRINAGRGKGHVGIIVRVNGDSVDVDVPTLKSLPGGRLTVRRASVALLRAPAPLRQREFRPYRPEPFRVPREGSDAASRLPSVAGDQLIYPRGIGA